MYVRLTDLYSSNIPGITCPFTLHVLYLNTGLPFWAAIVATGTIEIL